MYSINNKNYLHKLYEYQDNNTLHVKKRLIVPAGMLLFCFLVIIIKLVLLGIYSKNNYYKKGSVEQSKLLYLNRAEIHDRNGVKLATNVSTASLYIDAQKISQPSEIAEQIVSILPYLSYEVIKSKLQTKKICVLLARHLPPLQQEVILQAGIPGMSMQKDAKRIYIHDNLLSHVIGLVNLDNAGVAGVEKYYQNRLIKDDKPLMLSIDIRIQHVLYQFLTDSMEKYQAIGAAAILMEIDSGEILGMVSLPDYNPNRAIDNTSDSYFNRAILGMYEMGSVLKIFNTAMVLDSEIANLDTEYDTSLPLSIGKFKISEYRNKNYGKINVAEIFINSSNKGSARMALDAGVEKQKLFYEKIGCLKPIVIELAEHGIPILPPKWNQSSLITISYGYGIAISPLHLIGGVATIVGGGLEKKPTLIREICSDKQLPRIIKTATSNIMRKLLIQTMNSSQKKFAKIAAGYYVGGKTGTRKLLINGKYSKKKVATTFVGTIGNSVLSPKYIVVILLEDPKGLQQDFYFNAAGWNATPTGVKILERAATILCLPPIASKQAIVLNKDNLLKRTSLCAIN